MAVAECFLKSSIYTQAVAMELSGQIPSRSHLLMSQDKQWRRLNITEENGYNFITEMLFVSLERSDSVYD